MQHLLDMRAGTHFDEDYDNPEADVRTYERVYLWRPDGAERAPGGRPGVLRDAAQRRRARRPVPVPLDADRRPRLGAGEGRRRAAARADRARWCGSRWAPSSTPRSPSTAHGNAMADGGVCATLRDLGRFGLLLPRAAGERGSGTAGRAGGLGRATPSRARPTGRRRSCAAATRPASRPARTTGTAGGYGSRPCRSSTPPASTARTCSCTCPSQTVVAKLSTWPTALSSKIRVTTDAARAIAEALGSGHI